MLVYKEKIMQELAFKLFGKKDISYLKLDKNMENRDEEFETNGLVIAIKNIINHIASKF